MYETFFGLVNRPFLAVPTLDRYYPASTIEQTFQMTTRAISRAEGPVAVFGGIGLGKTMFCMRISEHFRRSFDVVMLASSQLITRRALLQSLLFELGMPYRNMNEGELRLTLMNRMQPTPDFPSQGLLLVVDEAQTLSPKLLDEIRLLTNITRDGMPRVRLVLCGTMKLEDSLSHPQMESLNQRLSCRCYLTPLTPQETANYVAHKIELCGISASSAMTRDALEAIYRGTDGIPRLIDQLADQSLLLAAQERQRPVSASLVGKAWGMLQQLPNPWSEPESIQLPEKSQSSIAQPMDTRVSVSISSATSSVEEPRTASDALQNRAVPGTAASVLRSLPLDCIPIVNSFIEPKKVNDDIIEFGSLDEMEASLSDVRDDAEYKLAPIPRIEPHQTNIAPDMAMPQTQQRNLLDVFGDDFDEEFKLPVQSSPGYQTYSGVAFGNLRDDSYGIDRERDTTNYSVPEASDFLEVPAVIRDENLFERRFVEASSDNPFAIQQIQPSVPQTQPVTLERQIEAEMREMVSDLNMSAMMFDPMRPIEGSPTNPVPANRFSGPFTEDTISFAAISQSWSSHVMHDTAQTYNDEDALFSRDSEPAKSRRSSLGDDRDLLVIEEDVENMSSHAQSNVPSPHRPVMHPYAKLFSNLR